MTVATFDFTNLRIILPPGDVTIEVERDLYSAWKVAANLNSVNMSAPPAFRPSVGGDSLSPGIEAGAYFFLQNQDGWRIRPDEADATVTLTGNLAAEDPALPMTVPTLGAFTVLINGLQPITQSVGSLLLAQQDANYRGEVWIDVTSGAAGTDFPLGTASSPVNNLIDAFTIAARLGDRRLVIVSSNLVLDRAAVNWVFQGVGNSIFDVAGFDVSGTEFFNIEPIGDFNISTGTHIHEATLVNVSNFQGFMMNCGLAATISLKAGVTTFTNCFSKVVGTGTPVVDCQSAVLDVAFRGYFGGLEITNFDQAANNMSVDAEAIRLVLGATVSNGDIVVRGVGELEDNSVSPATVNSVGFVDAQEIEIIHQLQAGNVDISADNQTITVFVQGSTTTVLATFSISADGRIRRRL